MLRKGLLLSLAGFVMLLGARAMEAQPAAPAGGGPAPAPAQAKDPVDLKLQDALRERDAIIRNLLERVSELEWRVNGGFTTPARPDERPFLTPASASRAVTSLV